jgi:hypothetical protein
MYNPYEIFEWTPEIQLETPAVDSPGWWYWQNDVDGLFGPFETEAEALDHRLKEYWAICRAMKETI